MLDLDNAVRPAKYAFRLLQSMSVATSLPSRQQKRMFALSKTSRLVESVPPCRKRAALSKTSRRPFESQTLP